MADDQHVGQNQPERGLESSVGLTDHMLEAFDREAEQLTRLWLFFAKPPGDPVLDSWGWDEQHNPDRLSEAVPAPEHSLPPAPSDHARADPL